MEKIDVIGQDVYCYDLLGSLIKSLTIDQFTGIDFSYLDGSKLFTLNITQPIKRVVKFRELNGLDTTAEFTEYPYENMTPEQQADFDSFVLQAETL
jgi:hypothetical protein